MEELDSDFTVEEIGEGIKRMKNDKTPGVNRMSVEMWREYNARNDGLKVMWNLFSGIKNGKAVPKLWRTAVLCPIYKGKGERK
jgi:hypothetical protein